MTPAFDFATTSQLAAVRIHGHCTREWSPFFVETTDAVVTQADAGQLTVDVSDCQFMDSTFLGCLVVLFRRMKSKMCILASDDQRAQLFSSARIDRLIPVRSPDDQSQLDHWSTVVPSDKADKDVLIRQVAEAHRCLADLAGPHAATCRTIADQLEQELPPSADRAWPAGHEPSES